MSCEILPRSIVRRASLAAASRALCTLALLLSLAGFTAAARADDMRVPAYERVQLPNGAVLLLMERHDVPLIAFSAVLRGGALADSEERAGTASILAALLEKGAGERDALQFAQALAAVGGVIETDASTESLSVGGSFLARDQKLMVELLADMLQRPKLLATEFEALRARHVEFIRAAKDSDLAALTPIYGAAALFGSHPYGRSVQGSEASLAALTHADIATQYRQQIGADRLILAVAGDFKTAQLKQLLTRAFGGWRKAERPLPTLAQPAAPTQRRVVLIDAPGSVQSYFWAGQLGVPRSDPRRATIDVVNALFGGRFTSMLNSELRVRTGLSYGASSRFERLSTSGSWQMGSFTRTETTVDAIDLALATLEKLHAGSLEPRMLESGKAYVLGQYPLALETADQWAYQLALLEFYGLDRSYVDGYGGALRGVSLDQAKRIIDEVFPASDKLTLVVIGNASAIRDGLRKYGPITEIKLSDPSFAAR